MGVQTFWLEETGDVAVGLRRYSGGSGFTCETGYHSELNYTGVEPAKYVELRDSTPHDDPRWPTKCRHCDYEFVETDHWQDWQERLYRRTDTGELRVLHLQEPAPCAPTAEPGACWDAHWIPYRKGPDGMSLFCRLPDGHDWFVDSRGSNCTRPDDDEHRCWVRHGDPRECRLTVDKNGDTCAAGAGSIQSPSWHGFLRDGQLVA